MGLGSKRKRSAVRIARALGVAATTALLPARQADGQTTIWTGATGNWSVASNWNPSSVPGTGVQAVAVTISGTNAVVSLDVSPTTNISTLSIDLGATLLEPAGVKPVANLSSGTCIVGVAGVGTVTQTGGYFTANTLIVGNDASGAGSYGLASNTVMTVISAEIIGASGSGQFNETGGYHQIQGDLRLAASAGSSGTFNLSGGSLYVNGSATIGSAGTGLFNLSGGEWYVSGSEYIGQPGAAGVLNQTGGYHEVDGKLVIQNSGSSAVNLSGGELYASSLDTAGSASRFNWTGGVLDLDALNVDPTGPMGASITLGSAQTLNVGVLSQTAGGTIVLNGGTLSVYSLRLASPASGFSWVSGTLEFDSNTFTVDSIVPGALGSPVLNVGTGRTLSMYFGDEIVGNAGTAALNLSGANVISYGQLYVGDSTGSSGTCNLSGGAAILQVSDGSEYVGYSGAGTFNQSGGTHTTETIYLGYGASGAGTYNQTGGINSCGTLYLGFWPGSRGTYNLSDGMASFGVLVVGGSGTAAGGVGTLSMRGGVLNAGRMKIWNSGSSAVNFAGGYLTLDSLDTSGDPSRFNWTGGYLTISGSNGLNIGPASSFGNSFTLDPSRSLTVANTLSVSPGGSLVLNGGTLTTGSLDTGGVPAGFHWTAGALTMTGSNGLRIDPTGPLGGAVSFDGADRTLLVYRALSISQGSSLAVNGGASLTVDGTLTSAGSLILNGGTVSAGALGTPGPPANFTWSAGSLIITGAGGLSIGPSPLLGNPITIGPLRSLQVWQTLSLAAGGAIILNGGTVSAGLLDVGTNQSNLAWVSGSLNLGQLAVDSDRLYPFGSSLAIGDGRSLSAYTLGVTGNVQELDLQSAGCKFIAGGVAAVFSVGFSFKTSLELDALLTAGTYADGTDLGAILPTNLTPEELSGDLSLSYSVQGTVSLLGNADLLIVPEPAGASWVALAAIALVSHRVRRHAGREALRRVAF
jgi:hypothetical protein